MGLDLEERALARSVLSGARRFIPLIYRPAPRNLGVSDGE
jgi:hypothetical protein